MCVGTREGRREETCKEGQLDGPQVASKGTSGSQSYRLKIWIFQGMENQIDLQSCEPFNKAPKTDTTDQKVSMRSARKGVPTYSWGCGEGLVLFCMETRVNRGGGLVSMDSR